VFHTIEANIKTRSSADAEITWHASCYTDSLIRRVPNAISGTSGTRMYPQMAPIRFAKCDLQLVFCIVLVRILRRSTKPHFSITQPVFLSRIRDHKIL